jgi:pyruvate/2-oxoglutarate dehydrogenase complex dihydrolipoamide acyltransferase (E2) component
MREPLPVIIPQVNPNDDTAVLASWHVPSGSRVAQDQVLATLETTKATFDVSAPRAGFVFYSSAPKSVLHVGSSIAWIADEENSAPPASEHADANAADPSSRVTRKAAQLMQQFGLHLSDFPALARITVADVERLAQERQATKSDVAHHAEKLEQTAAKVLEVRALSAVYRQVVPSSVCVAVCCAKTDLRLRQLADEIGTVSLLELAIHEVARLLDRYPQLNGYYENGQAWRHRTIGIGFAMSCGKSLRVPVIRNAAALTQLETARRIRDLSLRYMRGELAVEDLAGGTFTVTDLSLQGVTHFLPVLNQRQSAILGICAERPGTGHRDLVLTFDHCMADGMEAAGFMGELRARLEGQPAA